MPQRITNISVVVFRDGKRQLLQPNTKFDFTADEVKNIEAAHNGALRKADSDADRILDLTKADAPKPKAPEDDKKDVETAPAGDKPLTAAQKKKQAEAEAKAKLADEQKSTDSDEGDL
ncbi:hypothetical protein SOP91_00355 (plasmid) [Enterobacter hormaechei]|uniref:DUF7443 domain-containing protein n=1 Tax=Enterobacter hormaechei TaxID=158836 RepID=UPI002B4BEE25|nr:hypothetical protein [Enterobacter hormaechei]WRM07083.1 hypothetical protein SOP91_00355 [Enterobacter hormaechei]